MIGFGRNNSDNQEKVQFEKIYTEAKEKYDTGVGLLDLNKPLARDNFLKAEELLTSSKELAKSGSLEEKQFGELLQSIRTQLEATSGVKSVRAEEAESSDSSLLSSYISTKPQLLLRKTIVIYIC